MRARGRNYTIGTANDAKRINHDLHAGHPHLQDLLPIHTGKDRPTCPIKRQGHRVALYTRWPCLGDYQRIITLRTECPARTTYMPAGKEMR